MNSMPENDYINFKSRLDNLMANIEQIDQDAMSFAKAKNDMLTIAKNLRDVTAAMKNAAENSNQLIKRVEEISVDGTIESFKNIADATSTNIEKNSKDIKTNLSKFSERISDENKAFGNYVKKEIDRFENDKLELSKAVYDFTSTMQSLNSKITVLLVLSVITSIITIGFIIFRSFN